MSNLSIDYNSLLSSDPPFGLPYDVTFLIFDQKEEKQGEVKAHKFIFAANSPVFKSRFTGPGNFAGKDDDGQVKITGTLEAFRLLTNFLYNQPTNIEDLSVDEIFDVVDLAHCYNIAKLEEALVQRLGEFVIAKDDVIKVAKKAEEFARFQMASQALLQNCAKTLQAALNDVKVVFEFSFKVAGSGDEVIGFRLLAMIKDLPPLQPLPPLPCSNCQKSPCLSGAEVTSLSQVRPGTKIATRVLPGYWGQIPGFGRTEVVSVHVSGGTMKVKAGEGTISSDYPVKLPRGGFLFRFACST